MADGPQTRMHRCIERLKANASDPTIRAELLQASRERLLGMARVMLRSSRVQRWEESNDLVQQAQLKLLHCFDNIAFDTLDDFFRLAAFNMRQALCDMRRQHFRPLSGGANHATPPEGMHDGLIGDVLAKPGEGELLMQWGELHEVVQQLSDEHRQIVDLHIYHGLTHDEIATHLGISSRTSKRLWVAARLELQRRLTGAVVES